ncbi:cation channel sperm-associated protein subunit delta-like [Asterias rubens]|uniref:cation channel sperm-associated protein subunit delta-like n=1 Tax=Asterias rubens TaxID=7604 RepID=UPI001455C07F|nr:cation channel sperm-associated protein subunit delta-like [Asterias rubens]
MEFFAFVVMNVHLLLGTFFIVVFSCNSIFGASYDGDMQTPINQWSTPADTPSYDDHLALLTYEGDHPLLKQHSYKNATFLYARGLVYLTADGFSSPTDPLYVSSNIPEDARPPVLQSATFAGSNLVMVVTGVVVTYNLQTQRVIRASGIPHDIIITNVASHQCCFEDREWCQKQDGLVIAYNNQSLNSNSVEYFLSYDAGWTFVARQLQLDFDIKSGISGATVIGTLSSVAFLVLKDDSDEGIFIYDSYIDQTNANIAKPVSVPFAVTGNQTSFLQADGGLGCLVVWDSKDVSYSTVSGKAVVKVTILSNMQSSLLNDGEAVQEVISNKNGDFAILTTTADIYFGREGIPAKTVKLPFKDPLPSPISSCVIRFTPTNNIQVLYPGNMFEDNSPTKKLQLMSQTIYVQQCLSKVTPALTKCQHQGFDAAFHDQVFYMDIGQQLNLTASVIPNAWEDISYMVTVSNPGIVSLTTTREITERLVKGVTTSNLIAHLSLMSDTLPNGHKDAARGISSLRMSVYDSSLMCHHKQQAVAYVVAGCPPSRHLRIRKIDETCDHMRNIEYTIAKNMYDPSFLMGSNGVTASEDKKVLYDYRQLGCPIVVYYQDLLKPIVDLYEGDEFIEEMKEDFIVSEIHGMLTYSYTQTASQAGCRSQPQSWLSLLEAQDTPDPATAWTRQIYRSCMEADEIGLSNPDQPYEVLSSQNSNQLSWSPYNGILVFNVSVVNPDYSFCQLRGQFAVQVYGTLPKSTIPPLHIMLYTCGLGLAVLLAFYLAQKLWPEDADDAGGKGAGDAQEIQ